jgi:hypothetical protein
LFCLSYIYFQFNPSILICVYYVFQFGHFTFNFFIFSLSSFIKVFFIVFNFIFQIKFMIFLIVIIFILVWSFFV